MTELPVVFDEDDLNDCCVAWFNEDLVEVQVYYFLITDPNDPERFPAIATKFNENTLMLLPAKAVSQMTAWLDEAVFTRSLDREDDDGK